MTHFEMKCPLNLVELRICNRLMATSEKFEGRFEICMHGRTTSLRGQMEEVLQNIVSARYHRSWRARITSSDHSEP